ncbi:MAG: hemerythrin domain-containing protein [Bacteroidota bacterium]
MAPLKRHTSLVPFSHDHRHILFLAQLLKKGSPRFQGFPTDVEGKHAYALQFFQEQLKGHILKEEQLLFPNIMGLEARIDELVEELKTHHTEIFSIFEQWQTRVPDVNELHEMGIFLEKHVRTEERQLFTWLQQAASEELLVELGELV